MSCFNCGGKGYYEKQVAYLCDRCGGSGSSSGGLGPNEICMLCYGAGVYYGTEFVPCHYCKGGGM